jgi:hypothetical protein
MRTLRRDLPLTILIDLLVQIVFIVIILWAFDLGTLEAMDQGEKKLSYEDLKRENEELRLENTALKDEVQELKSRVAQLEKKSSQQKKEIDDLRSEAKLKEKKISEYEQRLGRKGEPDCFGSDLTGSPVLVFRWVSGNEVDVRQGANFLEADKAIGFPKSIFGIRKADQLPGELASITSFGLKNNCKVRLQFEAPANLPAASWLSARDSIMAIKGTRVNTHLPR